MTDTLFEGLQGPQGKQGYRGLRGGSGLGCLAPLVGIAGLVATFSMGPIDLGRSIYNQIIGDTPVLKQQLLDYSGRRMSETGLARELGYRLPEGEQINPQNVGIERLWDAAEKHAPSLYEQWVWTTLEE